MAIFNIRYLAVTWLAALTSCVGGTFMRKRDNHGLKNPFDIMKRAFKQVRLRESCSPC